MILYSKATCSVADCTKQTVARSWCRAHYMRWRRKGIPSSPSRFDRRSAIFKENVALIPLGVEAKQGYASVDRDFAYLDKYHWLCTSHGYVAATIDGKQQYLHRVVLGIDQEPKEVYVDHINHDKLDNRISNLRRATNSQNQGNRSGIRASSGYRGVVQQGIRYAVFFGGDYENNRYKGSYATAKEAAEQYNKLARERYGSYAQLNLV